jgi:magnesium-transporting ATPase (P-type)
MTEPVEHHKKNVINTFWFWILVVSVIFIIIAIIIRGVSKTSDFWFWMLISVGILGVFIGIILLIEWTMQPSKQAKLEKMAKEMQQDASQKSTLLASPVIA